MEGFETLASGQGAGGAERECVANRVFMCGTDLVGVCNLESCFLCGVWVGDAMRDRKAASIMRYRMLYGLTSAVLFFLVGEVANAEGGCSDFIYSCDEWSPFLSWMVGGCGTLLFFSSTGGSRSALSEPTL